MGDETVIYDRDSHVAHALKPLAAAVYKYADGSHTAPEIAELAGYRLALQISESDVVEAVEQLDALGLLDSPELDIAGGVSRRDALKVFAATGAGVALISSVAAPAAFAGMAHAGASYTCGNGCDALAGPHGSLPQAHINGRMVNADWYEFIGLACDTNSGNCNGSGKQLSRAYCASLDNGTYFPTSNTCKSGWSYNDGLGTGTYQCVPCDGSCGGCNWQSCQVVCVPAGTTIPGAITTPGSSAPYNTPCDTGAKQSKYCTSNPCNTPKSGCPACS